MGRNDQQDLAPDLTCTHVGGKLPEIDYKQCSATVVTFLNFGESNRIHQQSCWALLRSSSPARHSEALTERLVSSHVLPTDLVHSKLSQTVPLLGRGGQPLVMHWRGDSRASLSPPLCFRGQLTGLSFPGSKVGTAVCTLQLRQEFPRGRSLVRS